MQRPSRRRILELVGAGSVLGLAGCQSSSGGPSVPTDSYELTATPTSGIDAGEPTALTPEDGDSEDAFGAAVALADDASVALVGVPGRDVSEESRGAAILFEGTDTGWHKRSTITPDQGTKNGGFGLSVAMAESAAVVIVGNPYLDSSGENAGAAYAFRRTEDGWTQERKFLPGVLDDWDNFGNAIALSGDGRRAIVSASGGANQQQEAQNPGKAFIFERTGGDWSRQFQLESDSDLPTTGYGRSVAFSADGTTAMVGDPYVTSDDGVETGATYVYTREDGQWTRQTTLLPAKTVGLGAFGSSVSLSNDGSLALIGNITDGELNGENGGAAHVFQRRDGEWTETKKFASPDGDAGDNFGEALALSGAGNTAVVGAWLDEAYNGLRAGSAYVFTNAGGDWGQRDQLTRDGRDSEDQFGDAVALSNYGRTAIVGAPGDEVSRDNSPGIAYIYDL